MKKLFTSLFIFLLVLAGCSSSSEQTTEETSSSDANVESTSCGSDASQVDIWTFWSSETRKPLIDEIISNFNSSQDEYCAVHTAYPYGDIWTKNTAAIAAGNPPDLVVQDIWSVNYRASLGQTEPITDYIANDDNMDLSLFQDNVAAAMQYEGETYALPFNIDTRLVYYDKAVLDEAGIDPESIDTWDDFQQAAFDISEGSIEEGWDRIGFAPEFGNGAIDTWLASSNKGQNPFFTLEDDGSFTWHVDSQENIDAFNYQQEFHDYYGMDAIQAKQADYSSGMKDPLISGEVGFVVNTVAYAGYLEENSDIDYGTIPIPEKNEGDGHWVNGGGFVFEIPKGAENADGGYALMSYMAQDESQYIWSNGTGDMSANKSIAEDTSKLDKDATRMGYEYLPYTYDVIGATPENYDFVQIWEPERDKINLGEVSVEDGLAEAQTQLSEAY